MQALGARLAAACNSAAVIFLTGQLGAGKTTLTRGFLRGLGYEGHVKSPTYTLVESYAPGGRTVYHFDFYRVHDPAELEFLGVDDYFDERSLCLIEWPECGFGHLPLPDLSCDIVSHAAGREVTVRSGSERGHFILHRFENDE